MQALNQLLKSILPQAELKKYRIPNTPIDLLLLDDENMHRQLSDAETAAAWDEAPYWLFCWASGVAMAQILLAQPEIVAGRSVVDIGSGSGIVAIAAKLAGASQVLACDTDPLSCEAIRANAQLNHVELEVTDQVLSPSQRFDLVLAADVLYDGNNHPLLEQFKSNAAEIYIADSRLKTLPAKPYEEFGYKEIISTEAVTIPDLGELEIHKQVKVFYYGCM